MDSLSHLRRQDKDQGVCGYRPCEVPPLLPKMPERDTDRRSTTENGPEQMSRTL